MILKNQFLRFVLIGGLNTGFSYSVYAGFLFFGLDYALANLLALTLGILFSFRTQGTFVFKNRNRRLIGRFIVCWALIYVLNITFIREMMIMGFDAYIAGGLTLPIITVLSYFLQRFFVFRPNCNSASGKSLLKRRALETQLASDKE